VLFCFLYEPVVYYIALLVIFTLNTAISLTHFGQSFSKGVPGKNLFLGAFSILSSNVFGMSLSLGRVLVFEEGYTIYSCMPCLAYIYSIYNKLRRSENGSHIGTVRALKYVVALLSEPCLRFL